MVWPAMATGPFRPEASPVSSGGSCAACMRVVFFCTDMHSRGAATAVHRLFPTFCPESVADSFDKIRRLCYNHSVFCRQAKKRTGPACAVFPEPVRQTGGNGLTEGPGETAKRKTPTETVQRKTDGRGRFTETNLRERPGRSAPTGMGQPDRTGGPIEAGRSNGRTGTASGKRSTEMASRTGWAGTCRAGTCRAGRAEPGRAEPEAGTERERRQ